MHYGADDGYETSHLGGIRRSLPGMVQELMCGHRWGLVL